MGPVVISNLSIVLLDCDQKPDHCFVVESFQAKEVYKHVDGLFHFVHVVHVEGVEGETGKKEHFVISDRLLYINEVSVCTRQCFLLYSQGWRSS